MPADICRILHVEDHDDTREFVALFLAQAGFEVVSVGTCAEAVERATQSEFHLYIVDNSLPDGSGLELCKRLQALDSRSARQVKVPILFCSGSTLPADRQAAQNAGAGAFISKPFEPDFLVAEVVAALGLQSKRRAV